MRSRSSRVTQVISAPMTGCSMMTLASMMELTARMSLALDCLQPCVHAVKLLQHHVKRVSRRRWWVRLRHMYDLSVDVACPRLIADQVLPLLLRDLYNINRYARIA